MAGRQAKVLTSAQLDRALRRARRCRHSQRNRVVLLLSAKAGLRAGEIAKLTWSMVLGPDGHIARYIELPDHAAKKRSGRRIPLNPTLHRALEQLRRKANGEPFVVVSERGGPMRPSSLVNWFRCHYAALGLKGCSSHSGRRTFITRCARLVHRSGGSLRDVQELAGHRSLAHTQRYIAGDENAKRRLMLLI